MSGHNGHDPTSKKNLDSGEGQWEVRKEVLGWMVYGTTRCIKLARDKQSAIDAELHKIMCIDKRGAIHTNQKTDWKNPTCRNSSTNGKFFLMTPINKILQVKPQIVWWKYFPAEKQTFRDWRTLLKEATR